MVRIVVKTAHEPLVIKHSDKPLHICMCGLAKNQPFCDGSHKATLDEKDDELYQYDEKGKRMQGCEDEKEERGCCGGGCCG